MEVNEQTRPKAPRVELKPDVVKIIRAITFVIAEADRRRVPVTQYDILKTLFMADKSHLNRFGRPVTFDNYYAMKDGPVASTAYNLLKHDAHTLRRFDIRALPWDRTNAPEVGSGRYFYSNARTLKEDDALSPSDAEALRDAFATIKSLTFKQIRELTHNDPAYMEAWETDSAAKRFLMSYGMLFDAPNFEAAQVVEYMSKQK